MEERHHIYDFKLPPPFNIGEPDERNQQKIGTWRWKDPRWKLNYETGGSGWEYADLSWNNWGRLSCDPDACTRRRKWYRDARLIESWIDASPSQCDDMCGSKYIVVDRDIPGYSTPSSISKASIRNMSSPHTTAKLRTLSSLSKTGKTLIRRHSVNLFNNGVPFMNMTTPKLYNTSANEHRTFRLKKF